MPTTVHIPQSVLARADARAKALGISRNKLIVQALEARLQTDEHWPAALVAMLSQPPSPQIEEATTELAEAIHKGRRNRKSPPRL
jgi:metal-responsive CopG/Arc/MetJ family transcriptional regulator